MWIGNVFLVILNIPLIGLWVRLLRVPYRLLYPAILVFCAIGVYSINNNPFDIWITIGFGIFGWVVNKLGCECAPLILGFILGPMLEENMRRALLLSRGDLDLRDRPDFGQSARRLSPSPSHRDTPGRAFGTRKGIC